MQSLQEFVSDINKCDDRNRLLQEWIQRKETEYKARINLPPKHMQMSDKQTSFLEKFVAEGDKFLFPPELPWSAFFSRERQRNGVDRLVRSGHGRREHPL